MPIKYKIYIISGVILAGVTLSIFLLILPLKHKVESLKQEIFQKNISFNNEQAETQSLLKVNQTLKNTDTSKIDAIFLDTNDALFLINSLENLALNNDCALTINLSEPTGESEYYDLDLNLTIKGDLNNILTFITKIEEQDYYINYQKINFTTASAIPENEPLTETNNTDNKLTAVIEAKTFWR